MSTDYTLEKTVWTEEDFERMGWHDSRIHGMCFDPEQFEFLLDVDYLFQWVQPAPGEGYFTFWVAPCTLVFKNAWNVKFDLEAGNGVELGLEIADLDRGPARSFSDRAEPPYEWDWSIKCQEGMITLRATGYEQHVRRAPLLQIGQKLTLEQRGGVSFAKAFGGA